MSTRLLFNLEFLRGLPMRLPNLQVPIYANTARVWFYYEFCENSSDFSQIGRRMVTTQEDICWGIWITRLQMTRRIPVMGRSTLCE